MFNNLLKLVRLLLSVDHCIVNVGTGSPVASNERELLHSTPVLKLRSVGTTKVWCLNRCMLRHCKAY